MDPIQTLRDEHEVILAMLGRYERAVAAPIGVEELAEFVDFFRDYADACHHAREEKLLFPALTKAGLPSQGGPIGCMLEEHDEGRLLLAEMTAALALLKGRVGTAAERLQQAALRYTELLRAHIDKENRVLFVIATELLGPRERALLARQFAAFDEDSEFSAIRVRAERTATRLSGEA